MQSVARQDGMQWVVPRAAGLHLLCSTGGVVRAGEGGVVGDIDNGEGAARCLGLVGAGVVDPSLWSRRMAQRHARIVRRSVRVRVRVRVGVRVGVSV